MDETLKDPLQPTSPWIRSRLGRGFLIVAGTAMVGLGVIGAFIPVLPTTPFLLLAAACYLRSSERLYHWLTTNRLFGTHLRRYRNGEGLPLVSKITTILLLWITLGFSILWAVPAHLGWLRLLLLGIGVGVTIHILNIKTHRWNPKDATNVNP